MIEQSKYNNANLYGPPGLQTPLPDMTPDNAFNPGSGDSLIPTGTNPLDDQRRGRSGIPFFPPGFPGRGPIDPNTGRPTNSITRRPFDPITGAPFDPSTGRPIDPVTGFPIDPVTGLPIDPNIGAGIPFIPNNGGPFNPSNGDDISPGGTGVPPDDNNPGTIPGQPEPPRDSGSPGLSQRDTIILAVFGSLFLLILLMLLIAWCLSRKREDDEDKENDTDYETANVNPEELKTDAKSAGGISHWFTSLSRSDESPPKVNDIENANIYSSQALGDQSQSDNPSSDRVSQWLSSLPEEKRSELGLNLPDYSLGNTKVPDSQLPTNLEDSRNDAEKESLFGILPLLPLFSKSNDRKSFKGDEPKKSKFSRFNFFSKKEVSDSNNENIGKKSFLPPIFPFISKKKESEDTLLEGIRQVPVEWSQEDFARQSSQNENLILDSNGKEVYVLPPMVRHTKVEGHEITDIVTPEDVIMGKTESKAQDAEDTSEVYLTVEDNNTLAISKDYLAEEQYNTTTISKDYFTEEHNNISNISKNYVTEEHNNTTTIIKDCATEEHNNTKTIREEYVTEENNFTTAIMKEYVTKETINTSTLTNAGNDEQYGTPENMDLALTKTDIKEENNTISKYKSANDQGQFDGIINLSDINESNMENIAGAVIITENTTIVHHKSMKSKSVKKPEKDEDEYDDLDKWAPPAPTSHVVIRTYTPTEKDELIVVVGDLIGIEKEYDDGWAKAQNITQNRKRGMLPLAVITPLKSGPTQTVMKSAGGIWKAGGFTSAQDSSYETITYRQTSLKYKTETSETKTATEESQVQIKKVAFEMDHNMVTGKSQEEI